MGPDDRPDLVVIQIYITSARRTSLIADYRAARSLYCHGIVACDVAAKRGPAARGFHIFGAGEEYLAALFKTFQPRETGGSFNIGRALAHRRAARASRPDQSSSLSGAQLLRGVAEMSAYLQFSVQGGIL